MKIISPSNFDIHSIRSVAAKYGMVDYYMPTFEEKATFSLSLICFGTNISEVVVILSARTCPFRSTILPLFAFIGKFLEYKSSDKSLSLL